MDLYSVHFSVFYKSLLSPGDQNYRVCLTPSSMSDHSSTSKTVLTYYRKRYNNKETES